MVEGEVAALLYMKPPTKRWNCNPIAMKFVRSADKASQKCKDLQTWTETAAKMSDNYKIPSLF